MKGFLALYRKELRTDFGSPVALVVVAVFWALSGYLFSFNLFFVSTGQMVTAFHNMTILLILVMPLVSMRAFAEEARQGTLELLLTLPLSDATLVAAKYAAGLTVLALMLAGTTAAVLPLAWYGQPDYGPIVGGYIGVFLYGALFLAIGIAVSSACSNQIVAASATWGILVLLWFMDYPAAIINASTATLASVTVAGPGSTPRIKSTCCADKDSAWKNGDKAGKASNAAG